MWIIATRNSNKYWPAWVAQNATHVCQEECQSCTQTIRLSRYWSVYDVCTHIETFVFLHQLWLWMYTNTCSWIYWKSSNWPTCFRIVSGLSQNAFKTQTKRSQNARRSLQAIPCRLQHQSRWLCLGNEPRTQHQNAAKVWDCLPLCSKTQLKTQIQNAKQNTRNQFLREGCQTWTGNWFPCETVAQTNVWFRKNDPKRLQNAIPKRTVW